MTSRPSHTRVLERVGVVTMLALGVWLAVADSPRRPSAGLDGSWVTMMAVASRDGLAFGRDIIFTYGPLATLDQESILTPAQYWFGVAAKVAASVLLACAAYALARRWLAPLAAATITTVAVLIPLSTSHLGMSGMLFLLMVTVGFILIGREVTPRQTYLYIAAASLAGGLSLLTKFSYGLLVVGTASLTIVLTRRGVRDAAVGLLLLWSITVGTTVSIWLVLGERLDAFIPWLKQSMELTSGYAGAMSNELPQAAYQWPLLLGFGLAILALLLIRRRGHWLSYLLLLVFICASAVKLGYTRHDPGHATVSFMLVTVSLLAVGGRSWRLIAAPLAIASGIAVVAAWGADYARLADPVNAARETVRMVQMVNDDVRVNQVESARSGIQESYGLSEATVSTLRQGDVHVDPQEAALAWAYDLNWDPAPIFQMYSAYTPALDAANARELASPSGPDYIVRGLPSSIDSRYPLWDSPQTTLAMICNYSTMGTDGDWLLLERNQARCREATPISSPVPFDNGQVVDIPNPSSDGALVLASIVLDNSLANKPVAALFKPFKHALAWDQDGQIRRIVREHEGQLLVLRMAVTAGWPERFAGDVDTSTLTFNSSGSIMFYEIAVSES